MIDKNICALGKKLGRVLSVEKIDSVGWVYKRFVRFRVELDVTKALVAGTWSKNKEGVQQWIDFKYERMSTLCYKCEKIDHIERTCNSEEQCNNSTKFGSWMSAGFDRMREIVINAKTSTKVSGKTDRVDAGEERVLGSKVENVGEGAEYGRGRY